MKPIVEPVLTRLARNEELLLEVRAALDVQFKRIAAMQVQIDHLLQSVKRQPR